MAWSKAARDKANAARRIYPERNLTRTEASKRWHERHPEQWKETKRKYYAAHSVDLQAKWREWYEKNIEKRKAWAKAYYRRTKAEQKRRARSGALKRNYGLTQKEIDALLALQRGVCAICMGPFAGTPNVDHCHRTRRNRGLLCSACNLGLGKFKDDIGLLFRASVYLAKHSERGLKDVS